MARCRLSTLLGVGLALLTLLAYMRTVGNGFVNLDDGPYVTENRQVQAGLNGQTFVWSWTTLHAGYWHPLTWLSLLLDTSLFGGRPWGYHLTSLLLHTANVVLLFAVLERMTGAVWRSALVAGLFAVHPMHVESVAWVAERKDVLSTLFWILTLGAYARYTAGPGVGRYGLVLLTFVLGLLSKPMLVTLPCVLLLLDYWPLRRWSFAPRTAWWLVAEKLPLLAVSIAASVMTVIAQRHVGAVVTVDALPLRYRVATALVGYVEYLAMTFWPRDLVAFYVYRHYALDSWEVIGSAAFLAAVTALVLWQARRLPYLVVGWLWFVGTLVPVIGLVQAGSQALADRFSYVPHIGLFLACVWGGGDLLARCRCPVPVRAAAAGLLLLVLAAGTWVQVGYWHDSRALWTHALAVDPENHRAHGNFGVFLFHRGDLEEAGEHLAASLQINNKDWSIHYDLGVILLMQGKPEEAEQALRKALRLRPGDWKDSDVEHNLGLALLRQGRPAEAAAQFARAQERNPGKADTLDGLGLALFRQGQRGQAVECFRKALEAQPGYADAHNHLGAVFLAEGKVADAKVQFRAALEGRPQDPVTLNNLGIALGREGDWPGAIDALDGAVRLLPEVVAYRCNLAFALHQAGRTYPAATQYAEAMRQDPAWPKRVTDEARKLATAEDTGLRDPARAVELASQACQATDGRRPDYLETLAAAQAAAGRFAEAEATANRALELAVADRQTGLAERLRQHLALYRRGQPLREQPDRKTGGGEKR